MLTIGSEPTLICDVQCELGEGPVWDSERNCLWFVDIKGRRLHRFDPGRGAHDSCAVRYTRSGCDIRIVNRPSAVVRPVMPSGEPFGLCG